jgi:purine-nucleoside phosphorylase
MTPHINANPGDYADIVLMPGDPSRAKAISNYMTDVQEVNTVRDCW